MAFWDDVYIGSGNRGSSTIKVSMDYKNISDNSVSFWINDCILGAGMTIFKNTPEGGALSRMIQGKAPPSSIQEYLDNLVLKHIEPQTLKRLLNDYTSKVFNEGRRSLQNDMANLLGI